MVNNVLKNGDTSVQTQWTVMWYSGNELDIYFFEALRTIAKYFPDKKNYKIDTKLRKFEI